MDNLLNCIMAQQGDAPETSAYNKPYAVLSRCAPSAAARGLLYALAPVIFNVGLHIVH